MGLGDDGGLGDGDFVGLISWVWVMGFGDGDRGFG